MNCMHVVMSGMKARRHGTIINVSSIAGRKSYPFHDAYGASKAYVHALTEAARRSMASCDVRVIVISPGLTQTDIERTMHNKEAYDVWAERGARHRWRHRRRTSRSRDAVRLSNAAGRDLAGTCDHADTSGLLNRPRGAALAAPRV